MQQQGRLDCHGQTAKGHGRNQNDDHFVVAQMRRAARIHGTNLELDDDSRLFGPTQGFLFAVADGLGLHGYGNRASAILMRDVMDVFLDEVSWQNDSPAPIVSETLEKLQEHLLSLGAGDLPSSRPGSTLTLAHVRWPSLWLVHLGDSRAYLMRGGRMRQLSRDHTIVAALRQAGADLDPKAPNGHSRDFTLWNAVGGNPDRPQPQIERIQLEFGDQLLLCSDGIWRELGDDLIAHQLTLATDAEEAVHSLVSRASNDDRTAIVARFLEAQDALIPNAVDSPRTEEESKPTPKTSGADEEPGDREGGKRSVA